MGASGTRGRARVFARLVLLTIVVNAGTVIGVASAYRSELWPWRGVATALYFFVIAGEFVMLPSLALGYGWTRWPLASIAWGLLVALLASLPRLVARFGAPTLAFVLVGAADAFLLRSLHGERLGAIVSAAAEDRKRRYPAGFGLVLATGLTTLLAVPAAVHVFANDLRDPADGSMPELGQRIVLYIGVLVGVLVVVLLPRSRAPLFVVLGLALLLSCGHLASSVACSPDAGLASHSPMAPLAAIASSVGLFAATRPVFRRFWSQYPSFGSRPSIAKADPPNA